ncbi:MAG: restriction endonuclease subunit S, partial [Bacteroidales bacterium]|nr:restriction endonuclease subunit S [Bacteroidales bacterium]
MEIIQENINLNNLDKSQWESHRFEQIAKSISERVEPTQTDLDIYVGLEHLDAEDIHIRRFGKREDVSGTKLRCYPGDVIFGRRRAYQRKAAVVNFDGFCSAHSLVLRPNPKVIDPQLFPFFLHSDQFMHRAVDISVGSLSPTINWGTLKKEKFLLPPKDQQARLASLLWALDEVMEREREVLEGLEKAASSYFFNVITKGENFNEKSIKYKSIIYPSSWQVVHLDSLVEKISNGISETQNNNKKGLKVTRIETISNGTIEINKVGFIETKMDYSKYKLQVGDILFSHINS